MAEAGLNLELRAVQEVKVEHVAKAEDGAKAEQGAKAVHVERVKTEPKADHAVGVEAETKEVFCEARAKPGGPDHEVAVVTRSVTKTNEEREVATLAVAAMFTTVKM